MPAASRAASSSAARGRHSRSRPALTPLIPAWPCRWLASERLPRAREFGAQALQAAARREVELERDLAAGGDRVAQRRRERVDQPAFEPGGGNQAFAGAFVHGAGGVGDAGDDRLQRLAAEARAEVRTPAVPALAAGGDVEAAVGRRQRRHLDAGGAQHRHPGAVRAEPGPAAAAQRQHHGVGVDAARAVRRGKTQAVAAAGCGAGRPIRAPALPAVADGEVHAGGAQAGEPGAQQRGGLHLLREHAPRAADEGGHAECRGPVAQRLRAESLDHRREFGAARAVTREEGVERLAVGQVQAAAPGEQELAPDRGHGVEHRHRLARLGEDFGRHQPGRAAADDGDVGSAVRR